MMPLLQIKNLVVEFEGASVRAVDGLSLEISKGSFTSIVGESGSGKSVTALSVAGLLSCKRREGEILFGSTDLASCAEEELRKIRGRQIAYVFQDPGTSFNPLIKIGRQLEEAYCAHFEVSQVQAREKALDSLRAARLKDPERIYGAFPHELSGGMKQRAMIAMALITGPQLLIADEPTTALDVMTEFEILELLAGLKAKGLSILFITHNLPLAVRHSDRIYVLKKGKLVERMDGPAFTPQENYSRKLFKANLGGVAAKSFIEV